MIPDGRPETWQLMVLAYVDGELDSVSRLEVEAWIRTDPAIAQLVRDLRITGKGGPFRDSAEPPAIDLTKSGEMILARLNPRWPRRSWKWLRPALLAAVAASMVAALYFACPPDHVCQVKVAPTPAAEVPPASADPLAEYADLPIATPGEARVSAVRGDTAPRFVACDDLLPEVLDFATLDDVQIQKTGRSAFSVPGPDDAPMIFQVQSRAK